MSALHRGGCWLTAALVGIACTAVSPVAGAEEALTGAILPARGAGQPEELKRVTSEARQQLKERAFTLALQADVRNAAIAVGVQGRPTREQLAAIAAALGVALVVAPEVGGGPEGFSLEVVAYRRNGGRYAGFRAPLPDDWRVRSGAALPALGACLARLFDEPPPPDAPAVVPIDLAQPVAGAAVAPPTVDADPYAVPPVATEPEPSPRLITEPQEDPPFWAEWDHAGIFADLGFILSWCQGETLCIDDALGYGGRLRVGYRISSYFALSVSGAAAAFQPPTSTDAQALAQVDTTAVWFGIFPGLRYHPVNHFLLDPFIGVDLGWVWNYYIESAQLELAPGVDIPVDIQAAYGDLLKTRTMVTMNAFAFVPQVGLRLFLSRGAAIGVLVEYMIPLWDEVCSQVYTSVPDQSVDSPEQCRPVEEAGSLQPEGLDKASELPRHLNLEIDLAFLF